MSIFIKRDVLPNLQGHLLQKEITLIIGPRQCGKTTLMNKLQDSLEQDGKKTLFLNLDFESDKKHFVSQEALLNKLHLEFGKSGGYVFIDEIQRKENAGLFLKGIYDQNPPYKFIVSGSGSLELKEKIHESLAGRKMIFEVRPISFSEFVNFRTAYRYEGRLEDFFTIEQERGQNFLKEYMNFGGYPRIVLEDTMETKTKLIDEIYRSYIDRDIVSLLKVEKVDALNSLVKLLASQIGSLLNYSEISNTLGISLQTVKNYLWYLEKTFILQGVHPYFRNVRKEITKSSILYFYDLGLRNYLLGFFGRLESPNYFGLIFQNFIFQILIEHSAHSFTKIQFWRTIGQAEVDFISVSGETVIPIEVKYVDFQKPTITRSLRSFVAKYHPKIALVVTKSYSAEIEVNKTTVRFIPFWRLLEGWQ